MVMKASNRSEAAASRSPFFLPASPACRAVGGKGDHRKFKHPDKPGHVTVPHPRKDLPVGTLRNIFRQAGWNWR
jgi:hypothetical protein